VWSCPKKTGEILSSEPPVASSTATQNSTERVLTRRQADLLPVSDVVGRWLHREPAFLYEHEPEHHLEELALISVGAEWLTRWQPISMHRALPAGATPDQVAEAAGTSVRGMYEQWKQWADGAAPLADRGRPGVTKEAYETIQARFMTVDEELLMRSGHQPRHAL
jgi:hypothetical protein